MSSFFWSFFLLFPKFFFSNCKILVFFQSFLVVFKNNQGFLFFQSYLPLLYKVTFCFFLQSFLLFSLWEFPFSFLKSFLHLFFRVWYVNSYDCIWPILRRITTESSDLCRKGFPYSFHIREISNQRKVRLDAYFTQRDYSKICSISTSTKHNFKMNFVICWKWKRRIPPLKTLHQ